MSPSTYIDALRARFSLRNDFAVAKLLKVERATVCNWRAGRRAPDEGQALTIARLLAIAPWRVLLDSAAYRAQSRRARSAWRELEREVTKQERPAANLAGSQKG
jgi:DNA-binding transcriptional regulator YdaS (Cro superfamily)